MLWYILIDILATGNFVIQATYISTKEKDSNLLTTFFVAGIMSNFGGVYRDLALSRQPAFFNNNYAINILVVICFSTITFSIIKYSNESFNMWFNMINSVFLDGIAITLFSINAVMIIQKEYTDLLLIVPMLITIPLINATGGGITVQAIYLNKRPTAWCSLYTITPLVSAISYYILSTLNINNTLVIIITCLISILPFIYFFSYDNQVSIKNTLKCLVYMLIYDRQVYDLMCNFNIDESSLSFYDRFILAINLKNCKTQLFYSNNRTLPMFKQELSASTFISF